MSNHLDPDEPFAEDLRSAFPLAAMPQELAEKHVAAMMDEAHLLAEQGAALAPASRPQAALGRLQTRRRRSMRGRVLRRVIAVAAGLALSLGGLAIAGALTGDDDPGDDNEATLVSTDDSADLEESGDVDAAEDADDQGEDADDQGEDADDQGDDANDDSDDNADDQGEDGDDQGEDADDQGEDVDDQGEDVNDQGDDGDDDSDDDSDDNSDDNSDDDSNSDGDQGGNSDD